MRRFKSLFVALVVAISMAAVPLAGPAKAATGGPIALLGIDAEADFGTGAQHGPLASYTAVLNNVLANTTNGGNGILLFGGTSSVCPPGDDVNEFWAALAASASEPLRCEEGAAAISTQSLAGFQVIAIASSVAETPSGGLTQAENDALAGRAADIAAFVNAGGGLIGLSQTGLTNPYAYLGSVGSFTFSTGLSYEDITPTPAGTAVGITDELDVCCWHDEILTYPSFLTVLATNPVTGNATALGGTSVVVVPPTGVVVKVNGRPHCADDRTAIRVSLVVRPKAGNSVVSVTDPVMRLTRVTSEPNALRIHLKSTTGSSIPAHQATVVINTATGDVTVVVDIPAATCT